MDSTVILSIYYTVLVIIYYFLGYTGFTMHNIIVGFSAGIVATGANLLGINSVVNG